jgi:hypothetical protein
MRQACTFTDSVSCPEFFTMTDPIIRYSSIHRSTKWSGEWSFHFNMDQQSETTDKPPVRSGKRVQFVLPPQLISEGSHVAGSAADGTSSFDGQFPNRRRFGRSQKDGESCTLLSIALMCILALICAIGVMLIVAKIIPFIGHGLERLFSMAWYSSNDRALARDWRRAKVLLFK